MVIVWKQKALTAPMSPYWSKLSATIYERKAGTDGAVSNAPSGVPLKTHIITVTGICPACSATWEEPGPAPVVRLVPLRKLEPAVGHRERVVDRSQRERFSCRPIHASRLGSKSVRPARSDGERWDGEGEECDRKREQHPAVAAASRKMTFTRKRARRGGRS